MGYFLEKILRPELTELSVYRPHPGQLLTRLDANEAPALLSPEALAAIREASVAPALNRYADPEMLELRSAIATRCGVSCEEVLVTAGSDQAIDLLFSTLGNRPPSAPHAHVVYPWPSFVMVRHIGRMRGFRTLEVSLDASWDLDVPAMLRAIDAVDPNLIILASPNSPTGNLLALERMDAVIQAARSALVVIDEAYIDYASRDQRALYREYPNVALIRTLSKSGFASLRVGWLIAARELLVELDKARLPYNVPAVSQRIATLALTELAPELERIGSIVKQERARLARELTDLDVVVAPSEANFLWVRPPRPAKEVFDALITRGVLVKGPHPEGMLAQWLRVTVGTPPENDRLLEALAAVLA
jgi:histidinol-phosphate aminotransferase